MPISLSHFLREQLAHQQLSEKEFAARAGLGLSHVYQILRAERKHTRSDTLDKIAAALGMTPADMAVAMGKATDANPDEIAVLSTYRLIPEEKRAAARDMLRGLAVQPTQPSSKRRQDDAAKRLRDLQPGRRPRRNPNADTSLGEGYRRVHGHLARTA